MYSPLCNNCAGNTSDSVEPTLAAIEKNSQRFREARAFRMATFQFNAHDGAEIFHLPSRQLVLRMACKTRVVNPFHPRVGLQKFAHDERVGALPLVAQKIGAHAALNQECGMRIEGRAHRPDVLAHAEISSWRPMMAPPITSPWPDAYLVRLCK